MGVGFLTVALLSFPVPVQAQSFTVNSSVDAPDANTGDGQCRTSAGECTLRAAVGELNTLSSGNHTITFALPAEERVIELASALPSFTAGNNYLTLRGSGFGSPSVEISGDGTFAGIVSPGRRLSVERVALTGFTTAIEAPYLSLNQAYVGLKLDGETIEANDVGVRVEGDRNIPSFLRTSRSVVSGNTSHGLHVTGQNGSGGGNVTIGQGTYVGTDATGTQAKGNGGNGLLITDLTGTSQVVIGSDTGNSLLTPVILAANARHGAQIDRARAVRINGTHVGVDATGTNPLGNGEYGLSLDESTGVVIGHTGQNLANVIGDNGSDGIWTYNILDMDILNNYVGTNAAGDDLGNGRHGIYIDEGLSVPVLPPADGNSLITGNTISANAENGIMLQDLGGFTMQENIIGLTPDESAILANGKNGICINGSDGNTIGGTRFGFFGSTSAGNVIAGNLENGVNIMEGAQNTVIESNFIGTNSSFAPDLGNSLNGINLLDESGSVRIGGEGASQNVLFNNGGDGVFLSNVGSGVADVSLNPNRYSNNGGLGINLESAAQDESGINFNDLRDADTGTNTLRNHPNIRSVERVPGDNDSEIVLTGDYFGVPETEFVLDFYYSNPTAFVPSQDREGENYLGNVTLTTDAEGRATYEVTFVAPSGATAESLYTVTAAAGNTSGRAASSEFGTLDTAAAEFTLTTEARDAQDQDRLAYQALLTNPTNVDASDL